jgi:hypothetical protein
MILVTKRAVAGWLWVVERAFTIVQAERIGQLTPQTTKPIAEVAWFSAAKGTGELAHGKLRHNGLSAKVAPARCFAGIQSTRRLECNFCGKSWCLHLVLPGRV